MIAFIYLESICQLLEATNEFISPDVIIYLHKFSILNKQHVPSCIIRLVGVKYL